VAAEPFQDSRRLTGCNFYFAGTGAALEVAPGVAFDEAVLQAWRENIAAARTALSWPDGNIVVRRHRSGASLAFAAPPDQLYAATEVNEWAWWSAVAGVEGDNGSALSFSPREKVPGGRMREWTSSITDSIRQKLPFDAEALEFVRRLRNESTDPEQLIWSFLRDRRLQGQKFRRQEILGPYVLDFYCHELKLAIELDGGQHNNAEHAIRDQRRDAFLLEKGIRTLRYWNDDVLTRTETVLEDIWSQVSARMQEGGPVTATPSSGLRPPSPGGRREADPWRPHAPGHAPSWDAKLALQTLRRVAAAEASPRLIALIAKAAELNLPLMPDDDEVTIGEGSGSRTWFRDELPACDEVPWSKLHVIPTALVTGSNGKTTTVRLLAAMTRAQGWPTAHSCTDGVFFDGEALEAGDFSGPTGARTALRQGGAEAAILETARGGMLRRGLALCSANVAIVTNIAADHFGEYGVHDLDDLAAVKLTVARAVGDEGLLVLNADDASLTAQAKSLQCPLGWFAIDFDHPALAAHREDGGATCGARAGKLLLHVAGDTHALGRTAAMPLTLDDRATYNIANVAGAALAAAALGVAPTTIAATLARFGRAATDNPGRLQHWKFGATEVFVDYAHNPDGLQGLFDAVGVRERSGRLAMILGHAGNREDDDLRAVASTAAGARPDLIVLKDISGYERGREEGEVAAIMRMQLLEDGIDPHTIRICLQEVDAVREVLTWAREGDLLVLPIHELEAREQVTALLDRLHSEGWRTHQAFH
jgi:UDP-N-acetylmuramyl tripeptide synthase/very-short-patch-repair endonuclease